MEEGPSFAPADAARSSEPAKPLEGTGLAAEPPGADVADEHGELLVLRLRVNTAVRFGVAAALALGSRAAAAVALIPAEVAPPLGVLGLVVAGYGVALWALGRHFQNVLPLRGVGPLRSLMVAAVVLDLLALAAAIALLGGARSPFMAFYLIHVTLSCILLPPGPAVAVTGVAFLLVVAQVGVAWSGLTPLLPGGAPEPALDGSGAIEVLGVYATLFVAIDVLVLPVVAWLRRTEGALRVRNLRLDRLSRLRRDFLHVAVHNLRAPAGASLLHVQNLRAGLAGPLTDRQGEWLDRIEERLDGLLHLLQDMQTLGEVETDLLAERAEVTSVNDVLEELVAEYRYEAGARGVRLEWQPGEDLPPVRVVPRLIREAVRNYLTNAFKFAPGGETVTVRTRAVPEGEQDWVRIEVEDEGPGIPSDRMERLFREFVRLPPVPGKPRPSGSGLGLSITRRIAEVHGGRIGAASEPNRGSVFHLLLPPAREA